MSKTQLKKLVIENFRALNNVEVEFGDHITVVCGKNGTSKFVHSWDCRANLQF